MPRACIALPGGFCLNAPFLFPCVGTLLFPAFPIVSKPVSVFIPTKNAGPLFHEVIQKLRAQKNVALELVIIDSGSTDDTVAISEAAGAQVHRIPPAEFNHGLTRDQGIGLCRAEVVVLMTQDASPGDDFMLERIVDSFADPANAGSYVRQVARPEHDVIVERNLRWSLTGRLQGEVKQLASAQRFAEMPPTERYHVCNFDNVCSALRRSVWEKIKFGRVNFAEDIEWSRQALLAGWKITYLADAFVVHSHDRPLRYMYQRSYLTHRKLFDEYGMMSIPSPQIALKSFVRSTLGDIAYVLRHQPGLGRKLLLCVQIPFLNAASIAGQFLGARDARRGQGREYLNV